MAAMSTRVDTRSIHLPPLFLLWSCAERSAVISSHVRAYAGNAPALSILEAGCGRWWDLDLQGIDYTLVGIDSDRAALAYRKGEVGDLDIAILGDLCTVALKPGTFDVIYCSYVLEHVPGAEAVLEKFVRWLKPGGLLVAIFPDRQSAFGFLSRRTPFWLHVLYKKYIQGQPDAGQPGHAPYRTYYDPIITRRNIAAFCRAHGLRITAEYGLGGYLDTLALPPRLLTAVILWGTSLLSLGRLSARHNDLLYVLQKEAL
jgi:SAM-dependent methyltransferase